MYICNEVTTHFVTLTISIFKYFLFKSREKLDIFNTVESGQSELINARPVHFIQKNYFIEIEKIIKKKIIKFYVKNEKFIIFYKRTKKKKKFK